MSTSVRFTLDRAALARMFTAGGEVWQFVSGVTGRILTRARMYAPVDTGNLRNSLTSAVSADAQYVVRGLVGTAVNYALAVHEGTRPHRIKAKPGGAMAFTAGGRKVYATSVRHPGTKGRPFLRRAWESEASQLA